MDGIRRPVDAVMLIGLQVVFSAGFSLIILLLWQERREVRRRRAWILGMQSPLMLDRWTRLLSEFRITREILERVTLMMDLGRREQWGESRVQAAVFLTSVPVGLFVAGGILRACGVGPVRIIQTLTLLCLFGSLFFSFVHLAVREQFRRNLPAVFRVINSRYLVSGDIVEALRQAREDIGGRMGRLLSVIREALMLNDPERREKILEDLRLRYRDPFFTLLLYLLQQAADKGGREAVMEQFIQTAEECLLDMEYRKNLRVPSRTYSALILLFSGLFFAVARFNIDALGQEALLFYQSAATDWYQLVFFLFAAVSIGILQILERAF